MGAAVATHWTAHARRFEVNAATREPAWVKGALITIALAFFGLFLLLPLVTVFARDKLLLDTAVTFDALDGPWAALSGVQTRGYEIRHGRTRAHPAFEPPRVALRNASGEAIGWQAGKVLGLYAHGLFEQPAVLQALFGRAVQPLDAVFDGLADFLDRHFTPGSLAGLIA